MIIRPYIAQGAMSAGEMGGLLEGQGQGGKPRAHRNEADMHSDRSRRVRKKKEKFPCTLPPPRHTLATHPPMHRS